MTVADLMEELRSRDRGLEVWLVIEDTYTTVDRVRLDADGASVEIVGEEP